MVVRFSYVLFFSFFISSNVISEPLKKTEAQVLAEEMKRAIQVRDQVIKNLIKRLENLESIIHKNNDEPVPVEDKKSAIINENNKNEDSNKDKLKLTSDEKKENEQLVRTAFERTLIDKGGVLLPAYKFELEPSISYVHSSSDRVIIDGITIDNLVNIGDIFSERVRRDSWGLAATIRMGLPADSQIELRIPYGSEKRKILTADNVEVNDSNAGIGDITLGISHQFVKSHNGWPDILGSFRFKSQTGGDPFRTGVSDEISLGTGYDSYEFGFTAVKVKDPVVFFGGLSYTTNSSEQKSIGKLKAGDSYGLQLGMALALNLDTSLSFGYDLRFTERTEVNNIPVPGSYLNTSSLSISLSNSLSKDTSVDISVGIGLTEDAPDVQFSLAFPMRF